MKLILENWRQHLKEFSPSPGGSGGHHEDAHDAPVEVFVWPIEGNCKVNAGFWQRRPGKGIHGAIDQNVKPGTPIRAVADGVVTNVQTISQFMRRTNRIIQILSPGKRVSPDYVGWLKAKTKYFRGRTSKVRKAGGGQWKAGVYITIEHKLSDGRILQTQYMHLKSTSVSKGAHVKKGQVLGTSGDTAIIDDPPHLHFVTRINGKKVDPVSIIPGLGEAGC